MMKAGYPFRIGWDTLQMGKRGPGSHVTWPEEAMQSRAKRSRPLGPGLFQGAVGSTGKAQAEGQGRTPRSNKRAHSKQ